MAKRREKGDGSIYQRNSDQMYVGCVRLPETGNKKYVYDKTRTGVVKKLKDLQRSIEQGTLVTAKPQTVQAYLTFWLDIRRQKLKAATIITYQTHINSCLPHIGSIKLTLLRADHLQTMYRHLLHQHRPSTLRVLHTILTSAFKDAIRWKHLAQNPLLDVDAPQESDPQTRPVLNAEQALTLLNAAQDTPIACFLTMALTTGMRRGELLALRWADLDLEAHLVSVQRTASYIKTQAGSYGYVETTPKTRSSKRSIVLPQFLIDALKTHQRQQNERRLQAGEAWHATDLVFCDPYGRHYPLFQLIAHFKTLLRENQLPPLHLHDLRHSTSALLAKLGVPAKVIQEILGHSSIKITQDLYGHVIPGMQREAMQKLDAVFQNASVVRKQRQG